MRDVIVYAEGIQYINGEVKVIDMAPRQLDVRDVAKYKRLLLDLYPGSVFRCLTEKVS